MRASLPDRPFLDGGLSSFMTPAARRAPASRAIAALLAAAFAAAVASAETRGTVPLRDLSWDHERAQELSRVGQQVLEMEGIPWQHADSERFIYHYLHRWMAERAAGEAETFYAAIKRDLKAEEDRWEKKAHIFLFESGDAWRAFVEKFGVDRWSGGLCRDNEIFVCSPPKARPFTGIVLPHEIAHLAIHRFVRGRLPVWLGEGFAEQQARRHFIAYTRPKGYRFHFSPTVVEASAYLPLGELASAGSYPSDPAKVAVFYAEATRLVQMLMEDHPDADFLEFLQAMADGAKFETALDRVYGRHYRNLEAFEARFREVAIARIAAAGNADGDR